MSNNENDTVKVRVGIMFTFHLKAPKHTGFSLLLHMANGFIRETFEQHVPAGVLMRVVKYEVAGRNVDPKEYE